jgi:TolA-binding protein
MPSTPDSESRPAPAAALPPALAPGPAELRAPAADEEAAASASRLAKEKAAGPAAQTPEERWLQEIRELLRAGKFTDAQLSLARFVKAYPGYQVPADILDALKPAD